jgi:hypothetical protein
MSFLSLPAIYQAAYHALWSFTRMKNGLAGNCSICKKSLLRKKGLAWRTKLTRKKLRKIPKWNLA